MAGTESSSNRIPVCFQGALTVGTYNVYCDDAWFSERDERAMKRTTETVDRIASCPVQILALQETNTAWEKVLENSTKVTKAFPHRVYLNDVRRRFENRWGGSAIFSVFPVEDHRILPNKHAWYKTQVATIKLSNSTSLSVTNVHLIANFPVNLLRVAGIRKKEIEFCCGELLRPTEPTTQQRIDVVLGDFNCKKGPCIDVLKKCPRGMVDVQDLALRRRPTWRGFGFFSAEFDHIFVDPKQVSIETIEVLEGGGSDHLALLASLKVQPGEVL